MTDPVGGFQVSQGLDVIPPKSGKAYPIPCDEWALLKAKISKMTTEPWFFHTVGSLLLGAAITTFSSILLGTFSLPSQQRSLDIAWSIFAVTTISGIFSLFFSHKERSAQHDRASEVVSQMELIEKRYDKTQ